MKNKKENHELFKAIKKKLWFPSEHMIIVRNHNYLNEKPIQIICHQHIANMHTIQYELNGKKRLFYVKRKRTLFTKNPEKQLQKTIVYIGKVLIPAYAK